MTEPINKRQDDESFVCSTLSKINENNIRNYISFSFFEHKDEVSRYQNSRKMKAKQDSDFKVNYLKEVLMPLTNENFLFRDNYQVNSTSENLDLFPNLFYETIQKYGGDVTDIVNVLSEGTPEGRHDVDAEQLNKLGPVGHFFKSLGMGTKQAASLGFAAAMNTAVYGKDEKSDEGAFMKGIKYKTGVAYNPNARYLYDLETLSPRSFLFNFRIVPESQEHAERIKKAEYIFQKYATPSKWSGDEYFNQVDKRINTTYINHFRWPKKVQVKIFVDGKEFTKFKYLPASITRFSSSNDKKEDKSDRTFISDKNENLYPSSVSILIGIMENKIFTRNDVDKVKN
jgi:hypothetical protein